MNNKTYIRSLHNQMECTCAGELHPCNECKRLAKDEEDAAKARAEWKEWRSKLGSVVLDDGLPF